MDSRTEITTKIQKFKNDGIISQLHNIPILINRYYLQFKNFLKAHSLDLRKWFVSLETRINKYEEIATWIDVQLIPSWRPLNFHLVFYNLCQKSPHTHTQAKYLCLL